MKTKSKVAQFITDQIEAKKLSQTKIATEIGYEKPNIITMFKQGKTKLPIDKACQMAESLKVDPIFLLEMCLEEYQPENWKALAPLIEKAMTQEEKHLITAIRNKVGGPLSSELGEESKLHFQHFLESLCTPGTTF